MLSIIMVQCLASMKWTFHVNKLKLSNEVSMSTIDITTLQRTFRAFTGGQPPDRHQSLEWITHTTTVLTMS